MAADHSFLFSPEFRQLCLYGLLLLVCVVALVLFHLRATLRRKSKKSRSWRKKHGKWDTKER